MIDYLVLLLIFLPGLRQISSVYYLLLGGLFLIRSFDPENLKIKLRPFTYIYLLYFQSIFQLLFIIDSRFYTFLRLIVPIGLIFLLNKSIKNNLIFKRALFLSIVISSLSLYIQMLIGPIFPLDGTRGGLIRFSTTAGNSQILGTAISLFLPAIVYQINRSDINSIIPLFKIRKRIYPLVKLSLIGFLVLTCILSLSRSALITCLSFFVIYLLLNFIEFNSYNYQPKLILKKKYIKFILFSLILLVITLFVIKTFFSDLLSSPVFYPLLMMLTLIRVIPKDFYQSLFPGSWFDVNNINLFDDFMSTRVSFGIESLSQAYDSIIAIFLGTGPTAYGGIVGYDQINFNHNHYFDLIEGHGLIGVSLYILYFYSIFKRSKNWDSTSKKYLISTVLIFLIASLNCSGIMHHPLWIGPLLLATINPIKTSMVSKNDFYTNKN